MNLCKRGHDKDVVGLVKKGIQNGKQQYRCRGCAHYWNHQPNIKASKWLYETKHYEELLERCRRWRIENRERYLAGRREHYQRVKRAGGKVAYFWQRQAQKSGVKDEYFLQHTRKSRKKAL